MPLTRKGSGCRNTVFQSFENRLSEAWRQAQDAAFHNPAYGIFFCNSLQYETFHTFSCSGVQNGKIGKRQRFEICRCSPDRIEGSVLDGTDGMDVRSR